MSQPAIPKDEGTPRVTETTADDPATSPPTRALLERLSADGVSYRLWRHRPFFTVAESASARDAFPEGAHSKSLFLRTSDRRFMLLVCRDGLHVPLKSLALRLGVKRFSFGDPQDMRRLLGVAPGSVTPLALLHDTSCAVRFLLDQALAAADVIYMHPLVNDMTIALSPSALLSFLRRHGGHEATAVALDARGDGV